MSGSMSLSRRTALGLLAALPMAGAARAQEPATARGRLVEHTGLASTHVEARNLTVWLPPGYAAKAGPYPVLYMHDGQNLFDASRTAYGEWGVDEHLDRLIAKGQVRAPIVVGIWNTPLRLREYVPADLIAALPDDVRDDVQGIYGGTPLSDAYLRFIVEEVKPFIDATYATLTGPADTAISGSSMGGLISLYAVMKYPQVFGAAACLSTHWPLRLDGMDDPQALAAWRAKVVGAFRQVLLRDLPAPGQHRFYFDRGDETLDQFYATFQDRMDAVFVERGYGPRDFQSLAFPGHQHNEASWNGRLDVPLKFLLTPA